MVKNWRCKDFGLGSNCLKAKGKTIFPLVFWKPAAPNLSNKLGKFCSTSVRGVWCDVMSVSAEAAR